MMNPTTDVLEKRLAELDGGVGALALASGQAAITTRRPEPGEAGPEHRVHPLPLRRHLQPVPLHARSGWASRRGSSTSSDPSNVGRGDRREHAPGLHGVDRQPEEQRGRLRGDRRRRARARRAVRRRQHRVAPALPALRPRRGHRRVLADEVHRRPRHQHRRRDRRLRATSTGRTAGSPSSPSPTHLPRPRVLGRCSDCTSGPWRPAPRSSSRRASQLLRDIGACLSPFNAFLFLQGLETLPVRHAAPLRERARGRRVARERTRGGVGELPRPRRPSRPRRGEEVPPGAAPARSSGFGIKGGLEAARQLHRHREAVQPPGQHRRRQEPGDPSGVDHAPAAVAGGAARRSACPTTSSASRSGIEDVDDIIADLDQAITASQR